MLHCKQITELVSLSQEQKLSLRYRIEIAVHLILCSHCRAFARNCECVEDLMKQFKEKDNRERGQN